MGKGQGKRQIRRKKLGGPEVIDFGLSLPHSRGRSSKVSLTRWTRDRRKEVVGKAEKNRTGRDTSSNLSFQLSSKITN